MKKIIAQSKGYILVSVLVIMMILTMMMYFFSDALFSELAISRNQKSASQALHLAEAGVQEAVWRIQHDSANRSAFLDNSSGTTHFEHLDNALLNSGSYQVDITNTAKAVATITATGYLGMGLKTAQRKVTTHVYQAIAPGPYTGDGGLFVGGPDPGDIYLHNLNYSYDSGYDRSSIQSGGNIDIGNANISVSKDILANGDIITQNSTITLPPAEPPVPPGFSGGVEQSDYATTFLLPGIDTNALKTTAQSQGQLYTSTQFANLINSQTTFNGVIYVGGAGGVEIKNKNLVFNGVLVSEGSVTIKNATVDINHTGGPSGMVTLGNLNIVNANLDIQGLVYIGINAAASVNANIKVTGAILAHSFSANNINLKLNFRRDWVNETLEGGDQTPVIKMDHWEEEY